MAAGGPGGSEGRVEIRTIVAGLTARIEELCRDILPNGRLSGDRREWQIGSVDGEPGRKHWSCRICLSGAKRGVWADFATGEGGDALDLVVACLCRGDKGEAIKWSKGWLGLDGADARALSRTRRAVAEVREAPRNDEDDAKRRRWARGIFFGAKPDLKDTPAWRYLLGRGIDLSTHLGRQPRALRFAPELYHRPSKRSWPALVAAVCDGSGDMTAVHRIWLEVQSDGRVIKAPVADPKMTLGRIEGGSVRLWRGASNKPLAKAPEGSSTVLMEGVEDGLVLAMARPEERYLAVIGTANFATVDLPDAIASVTLFLDNDTGDAKKMAGLQRSIDRAVVAHRAAGREVLLARPLGGAKDANDLLLGKEAA